MRKVGSPYRLFILIAMVAVGIWAGGVELFARASAVDKQAATSQPASQDHPQKSGEQVFMQNCSRCHKPPMTISPRTTGTIVMHMRVRARLSREDEQALLRYLAP